MSILKFQKTINNKTYLTVSVLGKSLKLNVKYININSIELNKKENEINLFLPKIYKNKENLDIINIAIQKLYDTIAETELEYALEVARHITGFAPADYSIKRMRDNFYKCSKNKLIINPDLVRFNRDIINTTIIQAFCKIKYKSNSCKYKQILESSINKYNTFNQKEKKLLKVS